MCLKCFSCNGYFKSKEDVFRDFKNFPICSQCLIENLEQTWEYNFVEYIMEKIEKTFNRRYLKWEKWFYENHVLCAGECHEDYSFYYEHKDNITVIDGKNYCIECIEELDSIVN